MFTVKQLSAVECHEPPSSQVVVGAEPCQVIEPLDSKIATAVLQSGT